VSLAERAHTREIERRLAEAEATIEALLSGQIDAVVDSTSKTPVLLSKAQSALRQSEERYRTIVETANEGIGTLDTQAGITFVNERFSEMFGYPAEEMLGKLLTDFMSVDAGGTATRRIGRSSQGMSEENEIAFVRKDRSELWTLLKTSPTCGSDGQYTGTLVMVTDRTGRKQAEEALRTSEERYRRIVETSNQGVWTLDSQGRTTFMNGRMACMLGYECGELIGISVLELVPEDWRDAASRDIARSRTASLQVEGKLECKDGSQIWVLLETAPVFGKSGAFEGSFAMVMDVTQRKKSEEALRVSEGRLMRLWDSSLVLIVIFDLLGSIRDINEVGARMLGYSRAELVNNGVSWKDITAPECWAADDAVKTELQAHGVALPWEKELIRKDGGRISVLVGAAMLDASEGIAIVIDVTEKKRAETDLLERVRLAALTAEAGMALTLGDALPDMLQRCAEAMVSHLDAALARIWILRPTTNELELQASAGMQVEAPRGAPPVPQFELGAIVREQQPYFTNDVLNDPRVMDPEWTRRKGIVSFAGYPLLVAGQLIGVVVICGRRPLSKPVQTGLGSLADAIAVGVQRKIAEEAGASLEAQLRQAQKMEAVGLLAGGVAHDFNNLLSIVLSYSELLATDLKEGDPMRADLEEVMSAGQRAADLTRQLLAFSRQQVLQPRTVDLGEIVSSMEKMLRRLIGEDVELTVAGGRALGKVVVDPGQMEQVIMNLTVNARDAMPQGGKLTIETAEVVLDETYATGREGVVPGPHVMLAVSDTGTGMDAATQARMFEPFFTTKGAGKGTGLGLATVFGIVRQSGGSIWVYSELGKGTTFKAYFPRAERSGLALVSNPPVERSALRGSETILLAEDEEGVRILTRTILRKYGYNVLEAQSGGDALMLCEQYEAPIHLLLTDVVMPRMSGRQLAERLVSIRPEMKVLYMSGYTDDAVVRHGILESTVAFIQKPITPGALARKVREVLA